GVDTSTDKTLAKSPREFAQIHSSQPQCMGCHAVMDPIGLGLENYNAVGQWRTTYKHGDIWGGKNLPVESEGSLSGVAFNSPKMLKELIVQDSRTHRCATKKIISYALGRVPQGKDACTIESISRDVVGKGGSFKEVVKRIVASDSFMKGKK
ncbi:MAG: DUF1585 domain-containing protein, partial [Bdellovibrionales bacterium]|nr:DUF1585 domain-containing protein [Bdellovibrionales bacterium]